CRATKSTALFASAGVGRRESVVRYRCSTALSVPPCRLATTAIASQAGGSSVLSKRRSWGAPEGYSIGRSSYSRLSKKPHPIGGASFFFVGGGSSPGALIFSPVATASDRNRTRGGSTLRAMWL